MISRAQVDRLLEFHNDEGDLVTSCYVNIAPAQWPPQVLKIRVKDLLQSAQHELAAKTGGHAQRESLREAHGGDSAVSRLRRNQLRCLGGCWTRILLKPPVALL